MLNDCTIAEPIEATNKIGIIEDNESSSINLLPITTSSPDQFPENNPVITRGVAGTSRLGIVQYENLLQAGGNNEGKHNIIYCFRTVITHTNLLSIGINSFLYIFWLGCLNVDDSVGSMIALENDVHILNGHHVTTSSQHLLPAQASHIDMTTLLSSSQTSSLSSPVTTIVTSSPLLSAVAAAVKNEPEDLTGQRRDSTNNNNNNSTNSNNNPSDPSNLIATTNDAINV